jgi:hypothetical protein
MTRRVLATIAVIAIAVGVLLLINARIDSDRVFQPEDPVPNGSVDVRYHTCGYITESGVTSHLADYHRRCG